MAVINNGSLNKFLKRKYLNDFVESTIGHKLKSNLKEEYFYKKSIL